MRSGLFHLECLSADPPKQRIYPTVFRLRYSPLLLVLAAVSPARSEDGSGIVFDRSSVASTMSADYRLSLGDPYSASFIKGRFPPFTVEFSNECEMECFVVSRAGMYLNVYGSEESGKITAFASFSKGTTDVLGNRVGMPLREALKSDSGVCLYEESIVCETSIQGLRYFAGGSEDCRWEVNWERAPGAYVAIPTCATLGGVEIRN